MNSNHIDISFDLKISNIPKMFSSGKFNICLLFKTKWEGENQSEQSCTWKSIRFIEKHCSAPKSLSVLLFTSKCAERKLLDILLRRTLKSYYFFSNKDIQTKFCNIKSILSGLRWVLRHGLFWLFQI